MMRRPTALFACALRLDFHLAHSGLQFQKFQLRGIELLAAGTVFLDALQSQPLFQYTDLQIGPV